MTYKLKDEVWHRVIQIVQLAMLTGTDVADYLRQIEVLEKDPGELGLTQEYDEVFERTLEQLTARLVELQAQDEGFDLSESPEAQEVSTIIGTDGSEQEVEFPSLKFAILPPVDDEEKPN